MDGMYACNAGAIAGVLPWMACMHAMQEQLQALPKIKSIAAKAAPTSRTRRFRGRDFSPDALAEAEEQCDRKEFLFGAAEVVSHQE